MLFCNNSYQIHGRTITCFCINQSALCGMYTSFVGFCWPYASCKRKITLFGFEDQSKSNFLHNCTLLCSCGMLCLNKTPEMEPLGDNDGDLIPLRALPVTVATASMSTRHSLVYLLIKVSPDSASICCCLGYGV